MYVSCSAETRRTTGSLKEAWTYWNKTHSPQLCLNKKASKVRFPGSKARLFLFIADYITLRRKMMKVGTMDGFLFLSVPDSAPSAHMKWVILFSIFYE